MGRKYLLKGLNVETEIIDQVTGDALDTITETAAEVQALLDASPAAPGLTGAHTLVVDEVNGNDADAALDPYGTAFATLIAAKVAAAASDLVHVRPGTYTLTGAQTLAKSGDTIFWWFDRGAFVNHTGVSGCIFDDLSGGGTALVVRGAGRFANSGASGHFAHMEAGSNFDIECDTVSSDSPGTDGILLAAGAGTFRLKCRISLIGQSASASLVEALGGMSGGIYIEAPLIQSANIGFHLSAGNPRLYVKADTLFCSSSVLYVTTGAYIMLEVLEDIQNASGPLFSVGGTSPVVMVRAGFNVNAPNGPVVSISSGYALITVESGYQIAGSQLIHDDASTGASRISLRARGMFASASADNGLYLSNGAPARYEVECDYLLCGVSNGCAGGELHIKANHHQSHRAQPAIDTRAGGKTFARWTEVIGVATYPCPIVLESADSELHILGGRVMGYADAAGAAITIYHDDAKVRLYPGAVLIAGAGASESIALGGGAATPTVVAMGVIAANVIAELGVIVAVGSLLVDAAVV